MSSSPKIAITGAAGLVGQNLILRLKERGFTNIVAIDKHPANTATLRRLHPDITVIEADLGRDEGWQPAIADAQIVVVSHAQIGGLDRCAFVANNVTATERLLESLHANRGVRLIHVSSSVVNSAAEDFYTESKEEQEKLVLGSGLSAVVLRPTLMFGWFDRKHLGWLARFMRRTPVFLIPGSGNFLRQPLYAGDFCNIIISCIQQPPRDRTYNITGLERISYVALVRAMKEAAPARAVILRIPYRMFWLLLRIYGLFDRDPPFTTKQLEALVTPDEFEVIDWPAIFQVRPTPLRLAMMETFRHPVYSGIALEF